MTNEAEPNIGPGEATTSLGEANLSLDRLAALIAVAEALIAIGRLRDAREAGQFSLHNFLLRAANEPDGGADPGTRSMVVLMRGGVFRRHAWFLRVRREAQKPPRLELPVPIDTDWDWWPAVEEIRVRLERSGIWMRAVGTPYPERCATLRASLQGARLVKIQR